MDRNTQEQAKAIRHGMLKAISVPLAEHQSKLTNFFNMAQGGARAHAAFSHSMRHRNQHGLEGISKQRSRPDDLSKDVDAH